MNKTFYIADLHLNHRAILEYCNRPYPDVKAMNRALIENWNSVVDKNDKVYLLGDIGMGPVEEIEKLVRQLKGMKYLVKGNHDVYSNDRYREMGFKEVYDHPIIIKDFLVLSHEPMPFVMNKMYANIFGHVHNSPMYQTYGQNFACVSVERIGYTPVSEDYIIAQFSERGAFD